MKLSYRTLVQSLCPLMGLCVAGHAIAAGFQINEMSPSMQGAALAGAAATTNDPSAMAFNPATLATVKKNQVYLGSSLIIPHVSYKNATGTVTSFGSTTTESGPNSQANVGPAALVPDAYGSMSVNKRLKLGIAITAPWGLSTSYDDNWVGKASAVESKVQAIDVAPTIALKVNQYLAVGASFNAVWMGVDYSSNIGGAFSTNILEDLTGNSWGYGFTTGILLTPFSGTHIGISYRSSVLEKIEGSADVVQFQAGGNRLETKSDASTALRLPEVVDIGVSQRITSRLTGLLGAQWTRWDRFNHLNIHVTNPPTALEHHNQFVYANWKNSWLFSAGARYKLNKQWTLSAGAAYDRTPTRDATRDPRVPGSDRYWVTMGVGYEPVKNIILNMTYEHIFMMPTRVNVTQHPQSGTTVHTTADYRGHADIIAGSIRWIF